eukprot:1133790-Amphidinium_carterae.1
MDQETLAQQHPPLKCVAKHHNNEVEQAWMLVLALPLRDTHTHGWPSHAPTGGQCGAQATSYTC